MTPLTLQNADAIARSDVGDAEPSLKGLILATAIVVVALIGGVGGWMMFAELDSAIIARGVIAADSRRKTVQHKEGGILRELLVKDGTHVRAGEPVALLDTTQADAQVSQLAGQQVAVQAKLARLRAEQTGQRTLVVPEELTDRTDEPVVAEALAAQQQLFAARWRAYDSSLAITRSKILQLKEQINSAESQLTAVTKRLASTEEETRNVSSLVDRGYERRTRLMELQRSVEDLRGRQGELRGSIAEALQAIAAAELEMTNLGDTRYAEIAREMEDGRAQEADLVQRLRAARDIYDRLEVAAPQDGVVVDVRFVTPGAVIGPAQPLMDIVPVEDELIVEAKVQPSDIEVVHTGLPAQVKLTAYKNSRSPMIDGEVIYISADQLTDGHGESYFLSRVKLSRDSLSHWHWIAPSAGMPAEVMIVTGKRKAIDYLVQPFRDRMRRAFREG